MSAMLCTGANFVRKNSCLVARIVPYYIAVLHLHILEPYPPNILHLDSVTLSHVNGIIIGHFQSYLNQCYKVSQLLIYDGNIVVKHVFSMPYCGEDFSKRMFQT